MMDLRELREGREERDMRLLGGREWGMGDSYGVIVGFIFFPFDFLFNLFNQILFENRAII